MIVKKFAVYVSLAAVTLIALSLFRLFHLDEFLRGTDAYYYALQADYWAANFQVKIPDLSPLHRVHGVLHLLGLSVETSMRLLLVLQWAACIAAAGYVLRRKSFMIQSINLLFWSLSPSILFTAIEFPKVFSLLPLLMLIMALSMHNRTGGFRVILAFLLPIFHKLGLAFILVYTIGYALQKNTKRIMIVSGVLLTVVGLLIALGRLSLADLGRFGHFSEWQSWRPGFWLLVNRPQLPPAIGLELWLSFWAWLGLLCIQWRTKSDSRGNPMQRILLLLPLINWIPLDGSEVFGVGERLAILMPFEVALAWVVWGVHAYENTNHNKGIRLGTPAMAVGVTVLLSVALQGHHLRYSHPASMSPPNAEFASFTQVAAPLQPPMLIAHRGLNFFYKYKTGLEAFPFNPEDHWPQKKVWRAVYGISDAELQFYGSDGCYIGDSTILKAPQAPYHIIREDCWKQFREQVRSAEYMENLPKEEQTDLVQKVWFWWKNPFKKRPAFLYPKHGSEPGSDEDEFSALP